MLDTFEIAHKLDEQNRRFYERFAKEFDQSRHHGWKGWLTLLDLLPHTQLRILDLGCGNGRLIDFMHARWIEERNQNIEHYVGLDRCADLLKSCRNKPAPFDISTQAWSWQDTHATSPLIDLNSQFNGSQYDWVTLFGVLHHVYEYQSRVHLLSWAAKHLRKDGVLSVSLWDFGSYPRWSKKILPRTRFTEILGCSIDAIDQYLEVNDHLLGWSHINETPRYCHWVDRKEEESLSRDVQALTPGLSKAWSMSKEGDLNRYLCWRMES